MGPSVQARSAHQSPAYPTRLICLQGTMLHEITHNHHGPHDATFYKKLDQYTEVRRPAHSRPWPAALCSALDSLFEVERPCTAGRHDMSAAALLWPGRSWQAAPCCC